jgi:hypothetical protein
MQLIAGVANLAAIESPTAQNIQNWHDCQGDQGSIKRPLYTIADSESTW